MSWSHWFWTSSAFHPQLVRERFGKFIFESDPFVPALPGSDTHKERRLQHRLSHRSIRAVFDFIKAVPPRGHGSAHSAEISRRRI